MVDGEQRAGSLQQYRTRKAEQTGAAMLRVMRGERGQ